MEALAIDGGAPVRKLPLPHDFPGAAVLGEEEKQAVLDVLNRQSPFRYYGPDPAYAVRGFEEAFSERIGTAHTLALSTGTAALIVGLEALEVGAGDEVLVPGNTFIATAGAVLRVGATPVYVDVDDTFNIDPEDLQRKRTARSRAVIPVHFEGSACDMAAVNAVAREHDLVVLEDVAQACGARIRGRRVGSLGHLGAFSFQINKLLTAGEGGALTGDNAELMDRAQRVHDQGGVRGADGAMGLDESGGAILGENYRMSELCGAVLREQTKKLDSVIAGLRRVADAIRAGVREVPGIELRRHVDPEGEVGRRIFLTLPDPDVAIRVEQASKAEGVPLTRLYGGRPVFDHPQLGADDVHCPCTRDLLQRTVTLSVGPNWGEEETEDVVRVVRKVVPHFVGRGVGREPQKHRFD